jgi:hypothetical protein
MTVSDLQTWLGFFPSPESTEVIFSVPGEAGRSDTHLPVLDINSEWHNQGVKCVLYPQKMRFHQNIKH